MNTIVIAGGGAAGFFAAIAVAQGSPNDRVIVLEAGPEPLAKVRISGGGRCNVTHACFSPAELVQFYPRGGKALRGAFSRFQPRDTIAWFQERGVTLKTEADGRMFPTTDDSATVVDCLRRSALEGGVELRVRSPLVTVEKVGSRFQLTLAQGDRLTGDRLLLATGSSPQGYRLAQHLGHSLIPPVPSLFTFHISPTGPGDSLTDLAGISLSGVDLRLSVGDQTLTQHGDLLITHWGLSGPAILRLSAWGARLLHDRRYQAQLLINWCPTHTQEQLRQTLLHLKTTAPRKHLANYRLPDIPQRLWQHLLTQAQIPHQHRWADLSKTQLRSLIQHLQTSSYTIQGKGAFKEEFVTCGGIPLGEVNFKTMASRRCDGLFLAGEILDIDGITGGFNFQSAWTTGWLAAQGLLDQG